MSNTKITTLTPRQGDVPCPWQGPLSHTRPALLSKSRRKGLSGLCAAFPNKAQRTMMPLSARFSQSPTPSDPWPIAVGKKKGLNGLCASFPHHSHIPKRLSTSFPSESQHTLISRLARFSVTASGTPQQSLAKQGSQSPVHNMPPQISAYLDLPLGKVFSDLRPALLIKAS